jgi:hypothetical protein
MLGLDRLRSQFISKRNRVACCPQLSKSSRVSVFSGCKSHLPVTTSKFLKSHLYHRNYTKPLFQRSSAIGVETSQATTSRLLRVHYVRKDHDMNVRPWMLFIELILKRLYLHNFLGCKICSRQVYYLKCIDNFELFEWPDRAGACMSGEMERETTQIGPSPSLLQGVLLFESRKDMVCGLGSSWW